jgi:hypothetical protein
MDRQRQGFVLIVLIVIGLGAYTACAGANGDPAPTPQEAGATNEGCTDGGVAE